MQIWDLPHRQKPFKYQGKSYRFLRDRFATLRSADRQRLTLQLDETGCLPYLV